MLFTYMLAGWEGSAYDTYVLNSALDNPRNPFPWLLQGLLFTHIIMEIYHNIYITVNTNNVLVCAGKYLLVDNEYLK